MVVSEGNVRDNSIVTVAFSLLFSAPEVSVSDRCGSHNDICSHVASCLC